ncbi:hypothetical protein IJI55_01635 [Candidatus Saccharibacteria bacterium]|nr:hypothetical protein [Candidatus Saccharibacteria bacterium]
MLKKNEMVLVIPAEGDSASTEQWYVMALRRHYNIPLKNIKVFDYEAGRIIPLDIIAAADQLFLEDYPAVYNWEIHAQAGFGAYIAYILLHRYPKRIKRVFFVGGAPCNAMTGIAKLFHRVLIRWWYKSPFQFFADDPNPRKDPIIGLIKDSSTAAMRADPKLYCEQILTIGRWKLPDNWTVSRNIKAYFVPNGKAPFPSWWNNTYDNKLAKAEWLKHDVFHTRQPGDGFSLYSMMPAKALFTVMDEVR